MILFCAVDGKRKVAIDLAEEEPGAGVAAEEQRVLAAPAEARARRELDLHHRRRVGERAVAERPGLGGDAIAELLQAVAQHLVVVAAAGIAGDVRPCFASEEIPSATIGRRNPCGTRSRAACRARALPGARGARRGGPYTPSRHASPARASPAAAARRPTGRRRRCRRAWKPSSVPQALMRCASAA